MVTFADGLESVIAAMEEIGDYEPKHNNTEYGVVPAYEWFVSGPAEHDGRTIYGKGGFHRYHVYPDGRVSFSRIHAVDPKFVDMAEHLGFDIH